MNIGKEMNEKRWILVNKWIKKDEYWWIDEWKKDENWWINEWKKMNIGE